LQSRADDVLISIAVLGLAAAAVDGEPERGEIDCFTRKFKRQFALSRPRAFRLMAAAVRRLHSDREGRALQAAFDCLNEQLNLDQKLEVFDCLVEIVVADSRVRGGEEEYLDYVALKLMLVKALNERYPEH
jgi:uncharacterized tellurite resistance protein B-like protein